MEIISRLLPASFLLLMMISQQDAIAGCCGTRACNFTYPAPNPQRAPVASNSASHAFTAVGGSRVAEINLSQEARDAMNAAGKEEPLPKGFLMAADREKLIAKQTSPYGSPEDEIAQSSLRAQSRYYVAKQVSRSSRGRVMRTPARPTKPTPSIKVAVAAKARQ